MDDVRQRAELNVARGGELLMLCAWLQGQMTDLLIFGARPDVLPAFIANPRRVPSDFSALRSVRWEKAFSAVASEFEKAFEAHLTPQDLADLHALGFIRNGLAHAHVSMGRDYLLYRPSGSKAKVSRMIEALKLSRVEGQSEPLVIKFTLWQDELYAVTFGMITRLDETCFSRIALAIGVPHSRIR